MLHTIICSFHVAQRPGERNQASIAEHTIQARKPRERFTGSLRDLRCTDLQIVLGTRLKIRSASCMPSQKFKAPQAELICNTVWTYRCQSCAQYTGTMRVQYGIASSAGLPDQIGNFLGMKRRKSEKWPMLHNSATGMVQRHHLAVLCAQRLYPGRRIHRYIEGSYHEKHS